MASALTQLGAVLRKSYLLKRKTPKTTLFEFAFPILLLGVLILVKEKMGREEVLQMFKLVLFLSYSTALSKLAHLLVTERENRIAEMMKILGLSSWIFYSGWFIGYAITMLIMSAMISPMLVYSDLLRDSNVLIIFLILTLYSTSSISFSMVLSVPFNSAKVAQSVTFMIYYLTQYITLLTNEWDLAAKKVLMFFFPSYSFAGVFENIIDLAGRRIPVTWDQIDFSYGNYKGFTIKTVLLYLGLSTIAYFLLYVYLDQVFPREIGTRKHPLFPLFALRKLFGGRSEAERSESIALVAGEDDSNQVRTFGLTKQYDRSRVALSDVSVDLKPGELTVLLGRNGSGKSTFINTLTGMIEPTRGKASVFGHMISSEMDKIRHTLGLCPQHDILWPELTVNEHFEIFGRIRGMSKHLIKERSTSLTASLGLVGKEKAKVSALSGGMKRKLSVALAFLGDPKLVILDEPTSGLDPLSRRHMWDILGKLRQDRVMLLSTHYMDEAEVLGERIVILSEGILKANGSVNELKLQYNCGYEITLYGKKKGGSSLSDLVADIRLIAESIVGDKAKVTSDAQANTLTIAVPIDSGEYLEPLLEKIRSKHEGSRLESKVDLVSRRLEEVFMKVSMDDNSLEELILPSTEDTDDVESAPLSEEEEDSANKTEQGNKTNTIVRRGKHVKIGYATGGAALFVSQLIGTVVKRFRMIIREKRTTLVQYLFPIVMLAMGVWVRQVIAKDESQPGMGPIGNPQGAVFKFQAADIVMVLFVQIALTSVSSSVVSGLNREKQSQSKFLQFVAGLSPGAYWTGSLFMDLVEYFLIPFSFTVIMVTAAKLSFPATPLYILLALYGPAILAQTYLVAVAVPNESLSRFVSMILNTFFGFVFPVVLIGLEAAKKGGDWVPIVTGILHLFPSFNLGYGILVLLWHSVLYVTIAPVMPVTELLRMLPAEDRKVLPKFLLNPDMYSFDVLGAPLLFLAGGAVVMFTATIVLDNMIYTHKFTKTIGMRPEHFVSRSVLPPDESVDRERVKAAAGDKNKYILRVNNVSKRYKRAEKAAVVDVPLAVAQNGEIFSILGENGAGKTSLVKMAIGELLPSKGEIYVGDHNTKKDVKKVRQVLGYCPQFDALALPLTVKDHLRLYARIKGVKSESVDEAVSQIVNWLGLGQYVNKRAKALSGGYRRRLSLAIALMGQPGIVFLDEPSCGMDPVARRQMWTVMESASERCAIVLTTHSMEEAESVSTRLGIMSKGRMICLGSAQELREKYSNGLEVFVQVTGGQVDEAFVAQTIHSRQSFIGVASGHSPKRRTRFLTSGMSLIGKGVNDETPDPVLVPAFAEWWAQENIFDSIEADVMGKLKGVSAFEASGRSVRFVVSPDSKIVDFDLVKAVFGLLAGLKSKGIVTDYSLTLNSLDQVFRSIASKEQEAEALELHTN